VEYIQTKFSDDATRKRYHAKKFTPADNPNDVWASFAWRTVRYLTKIEEGIDRLALAGLLDEQSNRGLAHGFSSVFSFDQRLRIIRLVNIRYL